MKKISQKQLTDHVNLVQWEEKKTTQKFNLLTVHSLLVNSNPKFIELKQKIQNFNSSISKGIDRKHLQYEYIKKMYDMLRQLVLIANYENQVQFLNNVYEWSKQGLRTQSQFDQQSQNSKSRPTTATTRARPFSAYSRPKSGVVKMNLVRLEEPLEIMVEKKTKDNIDYQKLKPGDIQFYTGARTVHLQEQKPKKKLKQYQRKIFYQEQPDSDIQIIDLKQKDEVPLFTLTNKKFMAEQPEVLQQAQANAEGIQNPIDAQELIRPQDDLAQDNEQDVNIDDLPMDGDAQQDQPQQVIDKLKPRFKAYVKHQTELSTNKISFAQGIHQYVQDRNKTTRKIAEDQLIQQKMLQWAKQKSRTKRQQKRRAESARIATNQIGIGFKKNQTQEENVDIINFEHISVPQTNQARPKTAFRAFNQVNRKELIKNCFISGNMEKHVKLTQRPAANNNQKVMRVTSLAQKPKKKTFEQILREAEEKVKEEQVEEILNVKQKFAKNKVPFQMNRIAKSVTYHCLGADQDQSQYQEFTGQITGMNMIKNPFIKVSKKKKKKKKKK